MPHTLRDRLDLSPRNSLAKATLKGESPCKKLADRAIATILERAIALAGLTKDQAAREMGYADASVLSKWLAGDNPNFDRLWSVESLRPWLVMALAEASHGVEVQTVVTVNSRRAVNA